MRFEPIWRAFAALLVILASTSACARRSSPPVPIASRAGATEIGVATWYGLPYHGRRTANGEIYDMEAMTAAHRTLAFGTWLRVDNMDNGKRTEVRVTDRGPFVKNRILDLSRAAAREIDMLGPGSARVKLTVIRGAPSPQPKASTASQPAIAPSKDATFAVQVGAFADRSRADHLRRDLEVRFGSAAVRKRDGSAPLWRVIVGNEKTQSAADALASRLLSEFPNAAVVRLDSPQ